MPLLTKAKQRTVISALRDSNVRDIEQNYNEPAKLWCNEKWITAACLRCSDQRCIRYLVAQYSLAKLYLSDDLEVRDTRKGMNWLYTAAVNGSSYAMYRLAKELLKGDLIKRNSDAAVEWFTRSAERGNPYAQYMLGKLYLAGKEIPRDEEKSAYWLTQSAEQGNQYSTPHRRFTQSLGWSGVRTKSWTKQRPQGGNRHIVHIRKESPRSAII